MAYETIETVLKEGILLITLNRPSKMNSLNRVALDEIHKVLDEAERSEEIKCVIVSGSEKVFCVGADISEVNKVNSSFAGYANSRRFQECFGRFEKLSKPVVAAVRGYALGGGCELMIACDFRIVAEDAKMGFSEVNIGAIPGGGGTAKLPLLINPLKAKEILCLGNLISGKDAAELGLVNKAVPAEQVLEEAYNLAEQLAQKSPLVLKTIKQITNLATNDMESLLQHEAQGFGLIAASEDFKEGTAAFLEKRKPVFRGK
ncbi:enoyl-CoA hydratase/isomerase family protein [Pelotomaculum sp. PtaB.Bin117]|uniref:enoyl-CoA hydratase/isomerase family protein n=1 Tax=Pelotomaculum sp. PtaB.Bin117 TaxID=1811694 RepID=UPI0009CB1AA2|nr:enoyl-CoA hydratase/isomerase family protein [Pelotomaculum sp. PtaB.Bin117]OPX87307.1 MAG: 2,3-dehydroadipyl-CoA hydratase [Pelotomaculum sp. PtaB.Bin117]OPY61266.1 MAG: 2,3-dehydroadipyl-CoA hydratase [Pelotomaculum sp. PtaU1.Bin065]